MFDNDYRYITEVIISTVSGSLSDQITGEVVTLSGNLQQVIQQRAPMAHTHKEFDEVTGKIISMYSTSSGVVNERAIPWNIEYIKDDIYQHTINDPYITVLSGGLYEITYYTNWLNTSPEQRMLETYLEKQSGSEEINISKSYGYSPSSTYPHIITGRSFTLNIDKDDSFRLVVAPPTTSNWYSNDYDYRRQITVDYNGVSGNFNNFPLYFTTTDIFAENINGYDIIFTDESGTVLPHEIQYYNQGSGDFRAWVLVDLSSTSDTVFYIYYGNSDITSSQEDKATLWAGYELVYHYEESGGTILDATGNHDGTNYGALFSTLGRLGNCRDFEASQADYIDAGNFSVSGNQITMSAWFNAESFSVMDPRIISKFISTDEQDHVIMLGVDDIDSSSGYARARIKTGTSDTSGTTTYVGSTPIGLGTWYYISVVYNGSDVNLYISLAGIMTLEDTGSKTGNLRENSWPISIGDNSAGARAFDGLIDETRIYVGERSQQWLQTEFNNQNSPSNFYTVGPEETGVTVGISLIPNETSISCRLIRYE